MLRVIIVALGGLLLGAAALAMALGAAGTALPLALFGGLLLLGTVFDQARYKPIVDEPPGAGWEPTGERFRDPSGGEPAEVWFNPTTGQRRYVRLRGVPRPPA
jgi:hypothetical protein